MLFKAFGSSNGAVYDISFLAFVIQLQT